MTNAKSANRRRYPGSEPFKTEQEPIFFGRSQDITDLFRTISVNELTVLHGKSGFGKTSLLNAGVMPRFIREGALTIFLRFYAYDGANYVDPLQTVLARLRPFAVDKKTGLDTVFLPEIQADPLAQTLWQQFKSIQWQQRDTTRRVVVVFDQFEELFTYPPGVLENFARQFGEVLDNRMPAEFRASFYEHMDALESTPEGEEAWLFIKKSLPLHLVLGIRSDRMSLLDRLKPFYEPILKNLYELRPLTREQTRDAIEKPAALSQFSGDAEPGFATPPFSYAPETLAAMLDFLTERGTKPVESTQIQVVCQHVENKLVLSAGQVIQRKELGDIKAIFKNYYDDVLAALPAAEQPKVRRLVENGLIFEPEQRRLSLFEGQVLNTYQISRETLYTLVSEHHLLRVEEAPGGGTVYELSHDSLVGPVLEAKGVRVAEEEREAQETERQKQAVIDQAARERLSRQRQLYWRFAIIACLLSIVAIAAAVYALRQSVRAKAQEEKATQQTILAEQNYHIAQIQRDSAEMLRLALIKSIYTRFYDRGKDLIVQKRYADARSEFEEAQKIDSPERDEPELQRLIALCETEAIKEKQFLDLTTRADKLRESNNFLAAYPLYRQARNLNFDNASLEARLETCEQRLMGQLAEEVRRAATFLDDGKNKRYARSAIQDYVDPILALLNLPADNIFRLERERIWKKVR